MTSKDIKEINKKLKAFRESQIDLDPKIQKLVNDNFFDLIEKSQDIGAKNEK